MNDFSSRAYAHGPGGRGDGGRERSGRGPGAGSRPDPQDKAQLAAHPVDGRRVLAIFRPHRWSLAAMLVLIVSSSALGLASPFLACMTWRASR